MPEPRPRSPSGRPTTWGAAAIFPVVAIILGLSGGFVFGRGLKHGPETPSPASVTAPAPVAAPAPPPAVTGPATATPAPSPAPAAPPAPAARAMARVHLRSTPPGAQVARASDGEPLGVTPLDLDLPESDQPISLLVWKKGLPPVEKELVPRGESTVDVQLQPKRRRSPGINSTTTIDPFN